ncbi:MAG: SPOR domain-containing protein [Candidatus Omnitrophica bacterium]|nr:SPOR domain-containing protein [Candidatus Omnitrophota bacterium]
MRILAHEKIILFIIGLLTWGLVSFSLGVERGKKIGMRQVRSDNYDVAMLKQETLKQNELPPMPPQTEKVQKSSLPEGQILVSKIEKIKLLPQQPKQISGIEQKNSIPLQKSQTGFVYTIQVASFKAKNEALKEVELLKKKGFDSVVLPKGKYLIVCVGNYPTKEEAKISLDKLKKKYQDCFIRRL